MSLYSHLGPMPDGHNAIRMGFDNDEPPAVIFNPQALPGALVSWAWAELTALNDLLDAFIMTSEGGHDGLRMAVAVQATLIPVINALEFAEKRAHALRTATHPPQEQPVQERGAKGKKKKKAA